ncbi:MAG: T9SS type A sorting domain-containing protein [Bacteroidales bacterium]|nr:T9SS type A sorting domain-containing protein [Bacteroidales bacterium]
MKKNLLLLVALCFPFMLHAQLMDTAEVFVENFDGAVLRVVPTSNFFDPTGDWKRDSTLYVSSHCSYHTPVYPTQNYCLMTTQPISLQGSSVNDVNYFYLEFDHICKVSDLDQTQIVYYLGYVGSNGNFQWAPPRTLSFNYNSDFYYGGANNSLFGGMFSDACYSNWVNGNMSAVPNNTWWHHELFDLSEFLLNQTVTVAGTPHDATHVRIGFRINKTSQGSGSEACAGWYIDNLKCVLSNCELIKPTITLQPTIYVNKNNNLLNNIGPYTIKARIEDNDTINVNTLSFSYSINGGQPVTVPNTVTSDIIYFPSGHIVLSEWNLPSICYYDTIRYHISVNDRHGSVAVPIDTPLIAWHNQTNIHSNDCHLDSLNTFPHCFITGVPEPVMVYFKNKSDATHSTGSPYQTSLNVTLKVEDANHVQTHLSTHNWTGSLCFDERDNLSLGTFTPTHGFNYITVCINTRNGQPDGFHGTGTAFNTLSDTIRYIGYSCDSLLHGDYTVGGSNPDFTTMAEVKAALNYCGVSGPTTFHLRPGTYQDFDFTDNYIGQSATNTITFQGDNVNTVIVTNNQTDAGNNVFGAVTLVHAGNYMFKNLTLRANQNAVSRGVVLRGNGCTNVVFDGCKIEAYQTNSTANTSFALGRPVAAAASSGQVAVSDTVIIRNCTITGGNYGIYYVGSSARRNMLTINNNRIVSCYRGINTNYSTASMVGNHVSQCAAVTPQNFTGIYAEQSLGLDIDGNTIDSTYDAEYGICVKSATTRDFFIRNNHVLVGNSNLGLHVEGSSSSATDTGYIYNNEVILYPVTATASYAMQIKSSNNLKLTNNSVYIKSDAPYSNTAALRIENNNNTFLNNNILLNYVNCSDNTNFPLYLNGTSSFKGSYNDFISLSGVIAYRTVARNTIAELESSINTTAAPNLVHDNISLLPPMANPTLSLQPTDYTGLECGRNADVANDIRGMQRTALTYMGAYANAIPATDVSVVAMVNPASGSCPQNSYNITVSVANKGSQTLNFASHNATITMHSDTLNLTQSVNVTSGSVPILGAVDKVVANNVVIPVNQTIDFTFIIRAAGDNNYANDTLRLSFVLEAAVPDYEEDFSLGTKQTWTIEQLVGAGNWSFQEGTGVNPTIAPVYGTGRLYFNSKNFANNTESRAIMPVVNLSNAINPILEVWFAHDNVSNKTQEGVTVKISTNGGSSFTALTPQGQTTTLLKRYQSTATQPQWTLYTYDLSNYVSSGCVYISFDAKSQQGNNINIDRIRIRNLYDNDVAVTNIYSNGETPAQYDLDGVVNALVRNEGRNAQNNVKVYLNVVGAAEQYHDSVTVASLASGAETIVTFPQHHYNVLEVKDVEVRSRNDQNNINNASHWRMEVTNNIVNYADTSVVGQLSGSYTNVIRPCVRYRASDELVVNAVKYYYDQSYIANPEEGMRAFVANAAGEIVATSEVVQFSDLQQHAWNIIPIVNFALTNMHDLYVGIEMLARGDYLCSQVETPLRDSTFYYLENGAYVPQTFGRFMIGAVIDTPHLHDLGILSMLNPTTRCDLGHEHITVEITNNGSTDIMPGTVFHYSVNGQPAVNQTLTDTLYSHQTTTFVFNTPFDFTNNQVNVNDNYNVRVWVTKGAHDRLQYNDTLALTIQSLGKSATPVLAQDTVNINYYTSGTLTASLPASITQGVLGWFTNSGYESWELKGYGNSYTTPLTFFDTVYYVNANPGQINDTIVGDGSLTGTQPFIFNNGYSRGKILYRGDEIGYHGTITQIGLYVNTAGNGADGIPIKIYMKKTTDAMLPTAATAVDWAAETSTATLVVDKRIHFSPTGWYYIDLDVPFEFDADNLLVYTETNCADYCTSTGSACNTCAAAVSGGATLPVFRQTNTGNGYVLYKSGNTVASLTGNYTVYARRLNMYFNIADLHCGSEKVPIYVHVPDIPIYDVQTMSWDNPTAGCALYDEHIQVTVKNMLNTTIPANKVMVHAIVNGTHLTQLVAEPFASEEVKQITFATPYDFSAPGTTAAPTSNKTFNYVVYTDMPDETVVYRGNDTISGQIISTYTAPLQASYTYTGEYTHTMEILQPNDRLAMTGTAAKITKYLFYTSDAAAATPLTLTPATAQFYTTPVLYDTVTYWVAAISRTSNCTTRRVPIYINVFKPQYDLITNRITAPGDYQCGLATSPQIQVNVGNTDTTVSSVIPAGTFALTANFTAGSHTSTGNATVSTPINHLDSTNVTVTMNNLSSTTQNYTYNYNIYSNPVGNMPVYRRNDTITGVLHVPANPVAPAPITLNATYGNAVTVTPNATPLNYYYFYDSNSGGNFLGEGSNYVTDPIFTPTTLYYSGRIENPDFAVTVQAGTQTTAQSAPLYTTQGHSYAKILYSSSEVGGIAGTIDTFFVNVTTANTSGVSFPVKIWLKNGADADGLSATPAFIWNNEVSTAQKVFDGELAFDQTGWLAVPVPGGFDYTGGGLYMYIEHDCGSASCVTGLGIVEPKFQNTTYSTNNQKKVLQYHNNTAVSTTANTTFTLINYRWNTKFKFNYTCESPRAAININVSVPQHDVGVVAITAPAAVNPAYSANETVTVTIRNFGTQAASNFPVSYQFDNNTPVTQNFTGSIAAGATANLTFTTNVDLHTVYYETPFKAFTGLSSDTHHTNDTLTIQLSKGDPCASHPQFSMADGADISNVTFAGINNGTGTPYMNYTSAGNGLYTDYTHTVPAGEIVLGQTYPISVTHSFTNNSGATVYKWVYIDYNRDGVFNNNEELVYTSGAVNHVANGSNATSLGSVVIPTTATTGLTRMRVICAASNINTTYRPCGVYTVRGETEDYAVNILPPYDRDMGIASYVHPVGTVCPDMEGKIKVLVKNLGSQAQTFDANNTLTLTTTVTGPVPGTYTTTLSSGTIAPGETRTMVIDNVNYSTPGSYQFSSQLTYSGDMYVFNNQMDITSTVASMANTATGYEALPYVQDFDLNNSNDDLDWLPAYWEHEQTNSNYRWKVYTGDNSPNSNYNAAPTADHTYPNSQLGHFAATSTVNNSYYSQQASMISGCLDLHYKDGYPAEVAFYDYFLGQNNSSFKLLVEAGSGSDYLTVDTVVKADGGQTLQSDPWRQHVSTFNGFDGVGRVRFRVVEQTGRIDVSLDDINVGRGLPDLRVLEVMYPYDFRDSVEHPNSCLVIGDTVYTQVKVVNNGNSPIRDFYLYAIKDIGSDHDTIVEQVTQVLQPGEILDYTFSSGFYVSELVNHISFSVIGVIDLDKNNQNNIKTNIVCTNNGLPDDYESAAGMVLYQNIPNPAVTTTRIDYLLGSDEKTVLKIYTSQGQLVYTDTQEAQFGSNHFDVDVSKLSAGVYYYSVSNNTATLTKKMVIQK